MRALRGPRGLSEIVGALMLVLIVVVAATAFSAFIASYQKQVQAQQQIAQQRSLEALTLLNAHPTLDAAHTHLDAVTFTVASLSVNPSTITGISIDHEPLKHYNTSRLNLTTGTFDLGVVGPGGTLAFGPRDQVTVEVDTNPGDVGGFSFYDSAFVLHTTDDVQVDLFTALENDFTRTYIPPTAIAIVTPIQTYSGGVYVTTPVLDGTNSFQPGNASLVAWAWSIEPGSLTAFGERVVEPGLASGTTYNITLTVTNSDGLLGAETIAYLA